MLGYLKKPQFPYPIAEVGLDERYSKYRAAVIGHLFMDISWKHRGEAVEWMEKL